MNYSEKILITGGHLTPALSVTDELLKRGYSNLVWVGHKYTMLGDKEPSYEFKTVSKRNITFYNLETGKLYRYLAWSGIKSFFKIPKGFIEAFNIVHKEKPDLVVSFGGYLAVPIVLVSKLLGIQVVTHEQTVNIGLANKIIAKFADHIFISWAESKKYFPLSKTILSGNPLRESIFQVNSNLFNFGNRLPIIYITGGNQGAHVINETVSESLKELLEKYNIIHQCGSNTIYNDYEVLSEQKNKLDKKLQDRYKLFKSIGEEEIGTVFNKSSLVIGRSGGNTIYELLAIQKFCLLIPLPYATNNEQLLNARIIYKVGLGEILEQKNLTRKTLLSSVNNLMRKINEYETTKKEEYYNIKEKARESVILNASEKIVDYIEKLLND